MRITQGIYDLNEQTKARIILPLTKGNSCEICQFGGRRAPKPNAGNSLSLNNKTHGKWKKNHI